MELFISGYKASPSEDESLGRFNSLAFDKSLRISSANEESSGSLAIYQKYAAPSATISNASTRNRIKAISALGASPDMNLVAR